jgi:acetamidase/formamidase
VVDGMKITWPLAETATHWIVMGLNPSLEEVLKMAVRETILFLGTSAMAPILTVIGDIPGRLGR